MEEPQNLEITLGENLQIRHWLRGLIRDLSEHHFAIVAVAFVVVCLFCCWFFFYRKKKNRNLEKIYNYTIFFQLHVLGFTIHTLLDKMSDNLAAGELDACLQGLVEVTQGSFVTHF